MVERGLLDEWIEAKRARGNYYKLMQTMQVEFEFNGPQRGHPSNYAMVGFRCDPSDELIFTATAEWPSQLRSGYVALLEKAVRLSVVESLLSGVYPRRGCAVTLERVGWDDVMSSEAAFWIATRRALDKLLATADWEIIHP